MEVISSIDMHYTIFLCVRQRFFVRFFIFYRKYLHFFQEIVFYYNKIQFRLIVVVHPPAAERQPLLTVEKCSLTQRDQTPHLMSGLLSYLEIPVAVSFIHRRKIGLLLRLIELRKNIALRMPNLTLLLVELANHKQDVIT